MSYIAAVIKGIEHGFEGRKPMDETYYHYMRGYAAGVKKRRGYEDCKVGIGPKDKNSSYLRGWCKAANEFMDNCRNCKAKRSIVTPGGFFNISGDMLDDVRKE